MVADILQEVVNYLTFVLMGLNPASALGSAVNFFIYDTIKILILINSYNICNILLQKLYITH